MGNIGFWELLLIVGLALLLFGSGKITTIMKDFGQGIKEFKKAVKENDKGEKSVAVKSGVKKTAPKKVIKKKK